MLPEVAGWRSCSWLPVFLLPPSSIICHSGDTTVQSRARVSHAIPVVVCEELCNTHKQSSFHSDLSVNSGENWEAMWNTSNHAVEPRLSRIPLYNLGWEQRLTHHLGTALLQRKVYPAGPRYEVTVTLQSTNLQLL